MGLSIRRRIGTRVLSRTIDVPHLEHTLHGHNREAQREREHHGSASPQIRAAAVDNKVSARLKVSDFRISYIVSLSRQIVSYDRLALNEVSRVNGC